MEKQDMKLHNESDLVKEQEEELLTSDDDNKTPPIDVIAFNEQRSCADLFRLVTSKQLDTEPDFQRGEVWSSAERTRFIDSLIKQLPIPSMCFSIDAKSSKRLVIDGLQRTSTVTSFLDERIVWKLSNLDDIDERLRNKTNEEIKTDYPQLWSIIENTMIPVTVIRCDYDSFDHMEYLYTIFHRLNTNSVRLNNQEVRNCIFNGTFNTVLKKLSEDPRVEAVYGKSKRFSTAEYLLRALAFNDGLDDYSGKMSKYLNDYMFSHRFNEPSESQTLILDSVELIANTIMHHRDVTSLSKTVLEGVMVGVMSNVETLKKKSADDLVILYDKLSSSKAFSAESLSEGLTSKKKVLTRLSLAKKTFKG